MSVIIRYFNQFTHVCYLFGASTLLTLHTGYLHANALAAESPRVVRYPIVNTSREFFHRNTYALSLFRLAIEKSASDYTIMHVPADMSIGLRNAKLLGDGQHDVNWMHTNTALEESLLPVRIPIFKGLIGWRLAFIREEDQGLFDHVKSPSDLGEYFAGQGFDWPDIKILEANSLRVRPGFDSPAIISLMRNKRIDYFPRSINEIWDERSRYATGGISIEKTVALRYASAVYFFVTPSKPELAKVLEQGLEIAIADGSFDALFFEFFHAIIEKSALAERKIFRLSNPLLPPSTPINRKELWYSIDEKTAQ